MVGLLISPTATAQDKPLGLGYADPLGALIIQAAINEGYFSDEGLTVTPIATDNWADFLEKKTVVGGVLDYQALLLAHKGASLVFTGGLYSGFLELVGREPIPGKTILATEDPLSGPAVAAAKYFESRGLDSSRDIKWLKVAKDDLVKAVLSGQASALTRWQLAQPDPQEPWGSLVYAPKAHSHGHGHSSGSGSGSGHGPGSSHGASDHGASEKPRATPPPDQTNKDGYQIIYLAKAHLPQAPAGAKGANPHAGHTAEHHFFQAFPVLASDFINADKAKATAITRALIRGARWVGENKDQAAQLGVAQKIWPGSKAELVGEIGRYMWMPGVSQAREHLKTYLHQGIKRGALPANVDEKILFEKVFVQLLPDFR
ncbi:MAG: ABC transporter substrate-binding protein [Deltaproteobacteria bacterium]|nr:ABC transporter substrate-binding protein [Deltaproteobacteria bacterium]